MISINFKDIRNIVRFEFLNGVKSKSFLFMVCLFPLFMFLMYVFNYSKIESKLNLIILNDTKIAVPISQNSKFNVEYKRILGNQKDLLKNKKKNDCILYLKSGSSFNTIIATFYYTNQSQLILCQPIFEELQNKLADKLSNGNVSRIRDLAKTNIHFNKISISNNKASLFGVTFMAIFIIYFLIFQFSGGIMQSISSEKHNKIAEILLSSMKEENILLGKILNGMLLAITQLILWIIVFLFIGFLADYFFNFIDFNSFFIILKGLYANIKINEIFIFFIAFLLCLTGGFLVYSAFYSILGAISNENTDIQQFSFIITTPLLLTFFYVSNNFNDSGGIMIFLSYFPLTSPIALICRVVNGIDFYEVIISTIILFLTVTIVLKYSSRLYKLGIIAEKEKVTLDMLFKWIKNSTNSTND